MYHRPFLDEVQSPARQFTLDDVPSINVVVDRLGRILALIDHIQLVFAKFFQAQVFRTGLIKSRQAGNLMQVGSLRSRAEIAQLHIFDHALTKRCHAMAPWRCGLVIGE